MTAINSSSVAASVNSAISDEKQKTHHLHQFWIVKVINDVFKDISVRHKAESPEYDHDGDLLLDVGQDADDPLTNGRLLDILSAPIKHQAWSITQFLSDDLLQLTAFEP